MQLLSSFSFQRNSNEDVEAIVPLPIQVVIDDVGWGSGKDGSTQAEPYLTGINRADYQAIMELGKGLGIRPQAATVLCEWDKENILKELPTRTWRGKTGIIPGGLAHGSRSSGYSFKTLSQIIYLIFEAKGLKIISKSLLKYIYKLRLERKPKLNKAEIKFGQKV